MVLARLGRPRVAIVLKESVERPSDIAGLIYLPFHRACRRGEDPAFPGAEGGRILAEDPTRCRSPRSGDAGPRRPTASDSWACPESPPAAPPCTPESQPRTSAPRSSSTRRYAKLADEALIYALRDREVTPEGNSLSPRRIRREKPQRKQYVDGGGGGNRTRRQKP